MPGIISPDPPAARTTRLTCSDYRALPDDGLRYEIIGGELVSEPSSRTCHRRFVTERGIETPPDLVVDWLGELWG